MSGMKDLSEVLFYLLVVVAFIQLLVYWLKYRRLAFYRQTDAVDLKHPVSIIICARNESSRLQKNLPSIFSQEHPDLEVIVVNDCSWDETETVLKEFAKQHPRLKIVTIKEQEKYTHGKKFALTLGIKAASHEHLLFTDADCSAASVNWATQMQNNFTGNTEFVLGYGPYEKHSGFLNKLIRFDTVSIAMQYLSAALSGKPYMGVGRNMSYTKSVFFRNKGFARHNHILSGDDDLFINQNANGSNCTIELNSDAFTYSEPKHTFNAWMAQKKRHLSTSRFYKASDKASLLVNNGSVLVYYLLLILLFALQYDWRLLVSLHVLLLLLKFPVIYKVSGKLKENDLAWMFPILELVLTFIQPFFYLANLLTKQKTWK